MADPFVAEIRIMTCNFAPTGWAFCNGQILPLSQNTALFSLLGTTYGGNGQSNFALPDIQGNHVMHHGQGPGLSQRFLGEQSGSTNITLLESEIPAHSHAINGANDSGLQSAPGNAVPARANYYNTMGGSLVNMSVNAVAPTGGNLPHNNRQPFLTLNFCIALQGVYPPRP